ncbi:MAG TPA: MFS transporter [Acidimicrobiales bacterium]|nr:MFS transporter [Acidimicrobiales bacterium]
MALTSRFRPQQTLPGPPSGPAGHPGHFDRTGPGVHYKWIALSNTTLGMLMATINSSITLIALPDIFRGIGLNPLAPGNVSYLLWMLMGFLVVTAVLVVTFGRIGDMVGRVKMYVLGFAVFTLGSILLSVVWMHDAAGASYLIAMRVVQGLGAAMLMANSAAILTDAFPATQRGLALGINNVAAIAGSFIGLVVGGLLGPVDWRLVFLVSVPFGLAGTGWAYLKLEERGVRKPARLDWWGNLTFAFGLVAVLVGITYGIQPYGGRTMGWTNPMVIACLAGGVALLIVFCLVERRVSEPMFHLPLFRLRSFAMGNLAALLSSLGRGGLMFMLIIWLQGIWLPLHGYSFARTPLWAGIYMVPLTVGFLVSGPISGFLSDHFGARPFATLGMIISAAAFFALEKLPVNFSYAWFFLLLLLLGLSMGLFASPNRAQVMNSLPPGQRGVGSGMSATFQNSAMVLSIGVFFSLMVLGLAASLPRHLATGLLSAGVPASQAMRISHLPPVGTLFAAFLGYNPMGVLLGPTLHHLSAAHAAQLTSRSYFPSLIAAPFHAGLGKAFDFAAGTCLVAAASSWLSGGKYVHGLHGATAPARSDGVVEAVEAMGAGSVRLETVEAAGVDGDGTRQGRPGTVAR